MKHRLQQLLANFRPSYQYCRDADGVDDLWRIYERRGGRTLATLPFWDGDPDWMARTEADAAMAVAALNAQRGRSQPTTPPGPHRASSRFCYVLRDHEHDLIEVVESANGRTIIDYDLAGVSPGELVRIEADARLIARALNAANPQQGA